MQKLITSHQNPLIKNILLLIEKPRERRMQNLIVIEGVRETRMAAEAGFILKNVIFCREFLAGSEPGRHFSDLDPAVELTEVTPEIYNKLAYRKDHEGILVLAEPKRLSFQDLKMSAQPLLLVLETVEKPGNLGALLRTADAAGLDGVIICDPQTDIYNPNAIRASLGCIFTVPVVTSTSEETISWLRSLGIRICSAALTGSTPHFETDFTLPSAIIMGSEAFGLSDTWLSSSDQLVKIPMKGKVDSMNVSASAAVVIFEALRQRGS
jgi:RNA methyltransferase, TrmH family